jgi:hypothetical protein
MNDALAPHPASPRPGRGRALAGRAWRRLRQLPRAAARRRRRDATWFHLDEDKARAFLARSLRRYDGSLGDGDGESWTLRPGWDLAEIYADEASDVEHLVLQAAWEAGAITCTVPGADVELIIEARPYDGWLYQWRLSFASGTGFALCDPWREEFRRIGWHDDGRTRAKGSRAALGVLREAVATANQLLAAYAAAGGRIPPAASPRRRGR